MCAARSLMPGGRRPTRASNVAATPTASPAKVAAAAVVAAALAAGISAWPARAEAYPQWQLSSGAARCNTCHFAPAGGGLPTTYGRDAVGEELSTFSGDGSLLHGTATVPTWLAVGGDLRGAVVAQGVQDA